MLANPILSPELLATMKAACLVAASRDPKHPFSEFFHGNKFQELYIDGCFCSMLDFSISLSTDDFEAWRQQGLSA